MLADTWRHRTLPNIFIPSGVDIYQFGVYNGDSIIQLIQLIEIFNLPIRNIFGFDTFTGLPKETWEEEIYYDFVEGNWNVQNFFHTESVQQSIEATYHYIRHNTNKKLANKVILIASLIGNLDDAIVKSLDMRPAYYIDIDVDLYSSAYQSMDFMFRNKLLTSGTYLAYDDWCCSPKHADCADGESRAHKEICEKYNAKFVQVGADAMAKVFYYYE